MAHPPPRALATLAAIAIAAGTLAACGGGERGVSDSPARGNGSTTRTQPSLAPTTTAPARSLAEQPCQGRPAPATYDHVVIIMMENRTWALVGGPGFGDSTPFLRDLATQCAYYESYNDANPRQNSLTQYIGLTSGVDNPRTVDDCTPSTTCSSTDDNIFRRVRTGGKTARSYVDGATVPCSVGDNAAKHIPALYYRGTYEDATGVHNDAEFCTQEVRPLAELDPDALPTFAFVTPTQCNDGHDCGNDVADAWLREQVGRLVQGHDYQNGRTAIFVLWDEDRPNPNLFIAPSAQPGPRPGTASHAASLKTATEILGLAPLASVADEPGLRASTPL